MANNVNNVLLGACDIVWGNSLIGMTIGGVQLDMITQTKPIEVDQSGTSKVNEFVMGRNVTIKLNVAEATIDNFFMILMNAGATQPNGPNTGVWVQTYAGLSLMPDAAPMLLRPQNVPNGTQDIYLPAVSYTGDISFSYKADQPRVFSVTFLAYSDFESNLFYYGLSPQAQIMGNYITDGQHYNVPDLVLEDRDWSFITDRNSQEIAYR